MNISIGQDYKTRLLLTNLSPNSAAFTSPSTVLATLTNVAATTITVVSHRLYSLAPNNQPTRSWSFNNATGEFIADSVSTHPVAMGLLFGVEVTFQAVALGALNLEWILNPNIGLPDCNVSNHSSVTPLVVI